MTLLPVAVIAVVAAVVGCGASSVGDGDRSSDTRSPGTSLTVTVDPGNGATAQEWTLTCGPPGGSHPDPDAACATLAELDPAVLEPVPSGQACTDIYGGPETATVSGELRGEQVSAEFSRRNGCEIDRWDAMADVLAPRGNNAAE